MNTKPKFRFKMFLTMVLVIFVGMVVQSWTMYRAIEAFFGVKDPMGFVTTRFLPLVIGALPIIILSAAFLLWRLDKLEKTVQKMAAGEPVGPGETTLAKKDLLGIPLVVFGANGLGFVASLVISAIFQQDIFFSTLGFMDDLFHAAGVGLISFVILGIFEVFLAAPRLLLHVTKVDDSLGRRTHRHRFTTVFVFFLAAWVALLSLGTGAEYAFVQSRQITALERLQAGDDKAQVSDEFFKWADLEVPGVSKVLNGDITALKPGADQVAGLFGFQFVFILVLGALMWWIGTRHQARQLGALRDRLNEALAGGDLGKKIEITQFDEVGEMASAINALTEIQAVRLARLTAAATAVDTAFGPLSEAAEEVNVASAAIMESTSDIAEKARNEIGSVGEAEASLTKALGSFEAISKSVEAQAGYVAEASSAMTEMASSIASVTKTTDEARALTLRLQESSQAGTQSLGASVEAIRAIEAASREVNALTAAIAKISAQTNLLAMNAAIEAAHAGEKGAGFAVVAEEVRNLALSSSESNKKIKQKTAEMLNLVGNGVRLTTEVGEAFGKINSDVAATATLVSEINSAMQEQNTGTDQILRSTASLVDTSHTIQRSAEVQKEQNTRLREAVARITTSFQSIHQGAQGAAQDGERIRQAVVRLEAVAREGQGVVDEMANLVNQGA